VPRSLNTWPSSIPRSIRHDAFELAYDVLGTETIVRFKQVRQTAVLNHLVAVAGICIHTARQAGFGEAAVARIGRKAAGHDVGKQDIEGISDNGVWTQARRLRVREEHCRQGGLWAIRNADRLPDALALEFTFENHHSEVPDPAEYSNLTPVMAERWGDLHLMQAADRLHAITSRPYVLEREGIFTADGAVELALAADPRAESPALPPDVFINGKHMNLVIGLGEIAEVLTVA
jgi:hypothetical protein